MLKKLAIVALVLVIIAGLMFALVYFIFIPKTAKALMPLKWRNISPGQRKESYYVYLGRPGTINSLQNDKGDVWVIRKGNYDFYLNINYKADSVAKLVRVYYRLHSGLFFKTENLITDSL